eukprot:m.1206060 g.1206060  ORF g.1206060 m.1206060 type:complete len:52 (-) comp24585_c1_seq22:551-706(-)
MRTISPPSFSVLEFSTTPLPGSLSTNPNLANKCTSNVKRMNHTFLVVECGK